MRVYIYVVQRRKIWRNYELFSKAKRKWAKI